MEHWTTSDANALYDVSGWGAGYFSIGENGHLKVHPFRNQAIEVDLKNLEKKLAEMKAPYTPGRLPVWSGE